MQKTKTEMKGAELEAQKREDVLPDGAEGMTRLPEAGEGETEDKKWVAIP